MAMDISFALEFLETEKNRKDVEENLRISEEQFRSLYENSKIGLYRTTPDGTILMANKKLVKLLGYPSFEMLAERNLEKVGFEPSYERKEFLAKIEKDGEINDFESAWIRQDGSKFFVRESAQVIHDSNGSILYYDGVVEDITEHKRAEEALQESEKNYRELIDGMNETVWVIDFSGNIIETNNTAVKVLGYTKEELKTIGLFGIDSSLKKENIIALVNAMPIDELQIFETSHTTKDGRTFPVEIYSSLVTYKGKRAILSIARDITERKQAEEKLQENKERFRITAENLTDVIYEWDIKQKLDWYGDIDGITGYPPGGYPRTIEGWAATVHPEDKDRVTSALQDNVKGVAAYTIEYRIRRRDGEWRWWSARGTTIRNDQGEPYKMIGSITDITERKRADDALLKSEKEFRILAESMPQIVWITRQDGWNIYFNQQWIDYTGMTIEESYGHGWNKPFHPDDKQKAWAAWQNATKNNGVYSIESRLRRADGVYNWFLVRGVPMLDANGTILKWFGTCTDINEIKYAEQELILAKDKAEEMNRLKSSFLSNMSHELRTPLIGILGFAELLKEELTDEDFKVQANIILESGNRLKETLDLILDLSKIEAESLMVNSELIDLTSYIPNLVKVFEKSAEVKGLELKVITGEELLFSNLDKVLLNSIVNNLVNNAIKYTQQGKVTIEINKIFNNEKRNVELKVKDTGIGIAEENLEIIFEPFRQASEGWNRNFEGTGLGLTLVKKYVESMNGLISVESKVGIGSTFKVQFPLTKILFKESVQAEITTKGETIKIEPEKVNKPLILYVEDDIVSQKVIKMIVEKFYKIEFITNGEDAVELAKTKKYDLILMDINLSGKLNGLETTQIIKKIEGYEDTPIIAVTAYAMDGDKEKILNGGCTHYISKPFAANDFLSLLSEVLES